MKLPNPYTQRELADARNVPPQNEPFAAINFSFHETYTRLVEQVLAQLGDRVPVVVLIGDDATLLCDGREQREQVIPGRYHELKALGHLAFGVQLTLMANGTGRLTDVTANELHEKRAQIQEDTGHYQRLPGRSRPAQERRKRPHELLCRARTLVDRVLEEGVSTSTGSRNTSAPSPHMRSRLRNWPCASSSNNCTRFLHGGATILARNVGPECMS